MDLFSVPAGMPTMPVKDVLRKLHFSLTLRRKLKKSAGSILINGKQATWLSPVSGGDSITIVWPNECSIEPIPLPLTINYEDDSILVIDKPAGLLVHPTTDSTCPTLANAVVNHLRTAKSAVGFHPVHRLDRNTSGLILIAKNPYMQHLFSCQGEKALHRSYLAVVSGTLCPLEGVIEAPIGRKPDSIIERMVRPDGQRAITHYQTITAYKNASLVKVELLTGRTHQIRVHLSSLGHPILGDDLYGGETTLLSRQALHAANLRFIHPLLNKTIDLTSPLPPDMQALLAKLV
jgi:23S rRNA pseudouridine1911/1915/1917 synthase